MIAQPVVASVGAVPIGAAPSGGLVVPPGVTPPGSVILVRGPVDVYGTVHGDVLTLSGDVVVHPGAHVDGTAASLLGRTTRLDTPAAAGLGFATSAPGTPPTLAAAFGVPVAWFVLLGALGAVVARRADRQLRAVRELVEQHPGRAVGAGIAAQLLVSPALVLLVVALSATLIGVVLVPLAIVVYIAAAAGLATLGFLAMATVLGRALAFRNVAPSGGRSARVDGSPFPVLVGLAAFLVVWLLPVVLTGVPVAALVARTLAVATTWLALSAGLGAALLTRAGTQLGRRRARPTASDMLVTDRGTVPAWQTPTPIATLVAARPTARPTPSTAVRE